MPDANRRRIAVVDDHEIVGVGVQHVIEADARLEYVATFGTVDDLLTAIPSPDLVLLDLRLADGSSPVQNVDRLVTAGALVLAITSAETPYLLRLVGRTAALGVVRKSSSPDALLAAIQAAARGEHSLSTDLAAALQTDPALGAVGLSPQEERVLALFADGYKAHVVASSTGIAVSTVDDYVRRIRAKYARVGRPAGSKVDLYKRAVEDGFLAPPGGA